MFPGASLDVGPEGRIGVVWTSAHEDEARDVYFAESTDGGVSFGVNRHVLQDTEGMQQGPAVAYDGDGAVHVLWEDGHAPDWDLDILYAASADGGASFSDPLRVNDDPLGPECLQQLVSIAGRAQGAAAVWMDGREVVSENVYFSEMLDLSSVLPEPSPFALGSTPAAFRVVPNPIRRMAWIRAASVAVYDGRGAMVRRLERSREGDGSWVFWDARDGRGRRLPAETYFLRLEDEERSEVLRVVLVK